MKDESRICVACELCDSAGYGTKAELERAGWKVEKGFELCPRCEIE